MDTLDYCTNCGVAPRAEYDDLCNACIDAKLDELAKLWDENIHVGEGLY